MQGLQQWKNAAANGQSGRSADLLVVEACTLAAFWQHWHPSIFCRFLLKLTCRRYTSYFTVGGVCCLEYTVAEDYLEHADSEQALVSRLKSHTDSCCYTGQ